MPPRLERLLATPDDADKVAASPLLVGVADCLVLLKLLKMAVNRLGEPEFEGVGVLLPDEVVGDCVGDLAETVTGFTL